MKRTLRTLTILLPIATAAAAQEHAHGAPTPAASTYAGQEQRSLKALSDDEIAGYREGKGQGMAKPAELNRHPGPQHVLELASQLGLTDVQRAETQRTFDTMHEEAVRLGALLIAREYDLEDAFASGPAAAARVEGLVREAARLQGEIRRAHLLAHVAMRRVLTAEQIALYVQLRGYAAHTHH